MITLKSHGFKFGRPHANVYFDVSYFKNPWRDENIRNEENPEARRQKVIDYMEKQEGVYAFADRLAALIRILHLLYPNENIIIALCCSAGEYRSPALVELLARLLVQSGIEPKIEHSPYSKI